MKGVGSLLLFSFLIFGILLNSAMLLADDNNSDSGNNSNSTVSATNTSDDHENETQVDDGENDDRENETQVDDDHENKTTNRDENKTKFRSKETFTRGNCTIKVERKVTIVNGKRVEEVKRKIKCADGTEAEVKIKVENRTEDGRIREKIKYEFKGREIDVDTGDGIKLEEQTNTTEYKLKARFEGNVTDINIMPDEAVQIILERLRAALNSTNFTVELKEIKDRNVPKVVYNVKTNKHGKFLGVFKLKLKVEGQVDPVTGEFLGTSKPWWAFLVTGEDSDQTGDDQQSNNETVSNETVNTTTPAIGFNETINGTFNAST